MIAKHITEASLGIVSLSLYGFGLVAQVSFPTDMAGGIVAMVTQFGGLGVAVWLVYYHTTSTIPTMQKEYREERQVMNDLHKELISEQRRDFVEAIKQSNCKYNGGNHASK